MKEHRLTPTFAIRPTMFARTDDDYEIAQGREGGMHVIVHAGTLADVAALGRALVTFASGLTVGAALALPEVQRGEAVVEYGDPSGAVCYLTQQARANQHGTLVSRYHDGAWTEWDLFDVGAIREMALPARLVPLATCDADPSTRDGGTNG